VVTLSFPKISIEETGLHVMKEITCAFCKGKGLDPFEILSPASKCAICGGKGKVNVEEPYIECAFCHGTGVHPHTRLSCTVCRGKGVVTFREPKAVCPECKGSGQEALTNLPCLRCGGKGVIREEEKISSAQTGKRASPKRTTEVAQVNTPSSAETEAKVVEESKGFSREGGQITEEVGASSQRGEKFVENPR